MNLNEKEKRVRVLKNLICKKIGDMQAYIREFIILLEGKTLYAYDDRTGLKISDIMHEQKMLDKRRINGCITVGVGFNMSRSTAKQEWKTSGLDEKLFDKVIAGKAILTHKQVEQLLAYSLYQRRLELIDIFPIWHELPIHVQCAIESIWYNCPRLVKDYVFRDYIMSGNYTKAALRLLESKHEHLSRSLQDAIYKRRVLECIMLENDLYDSKYECNVRISNDFDVDVINDQHDIRYECNVRISDDFDAEDEYNRFMSSCELVCQIQSTIVHFIR